MYVNVILFCCCFHLLMRSPLVWYGNDGEWIPFASLKHHLKFYLPTEAPVHKSIFFFTMLMVQLLYNWMSKSWKYQLFKVRSMPAAWQQWQFYSWRAVYFTRSLMFITITTTPLKRAIKNDVWISCRSFKPTSSVHIQIIVVNYMTKIYFYTLLPVLCD